jgi:molecular chaperone Hsp33
MSAPRLSSQAQAGPGTAGDDLVLPFQAERSGIMGRIVRLGPAVHDVLTRHDYPDPVSQALGEGLALTAMLGTTLKEQSKLILQTQTDGPLRLMVVNYESPGQFRGYARFDRDRVAVIDPKNQGQLLGRGHLGLTIDLGRHTEPYQGIVALEGEPLAEAALTYFQRSAQLPTFIRLAVAKHFVAASAGRPGYWNWRAGGLLLQHLSPDRGDEFKGAHVAPDETPISHDDAWERTRLLAATVEDHELLDPTLAPERLLCRLFHEEGVRVYPSHAMAMKCRCSRDRIERMLRMFSPQDVADMREPDGSISVTCEFCTTTQAFTGEQLAAVLADNPGSPSRT